MEKLRILLSQIFIVFFGKKTNLVNDELFNRILFYLRTGKKANLKNPVTFNENVLARKVFCEEEFAYSVYTDKFEVRNYVEAKIGNDYLVPVSGVWESVDAIDPETLDNSFVLKSTHGSGWNVVVRDKSAFNKDKDCKILEKSLRCNYYHKSREKNYRDITPRIICEKYVDTKNEKGLVDFKSYCFYGKTEFFEVTYTKNGEMYQTLFYTDFTPVGMLNGRKQAEIDENVRENKEKIISLAEVLAADFDFVRVDFYLADSKIYFSELTFHSGGGIRPFRPAEVDVKLGSFLMII